MTLEEKKNRTNRLRKRMIKFHLLMVYSMNNKPLKKESDNRFDDTFEQVYEAIKPALHLKLLAHEFFKIQAIKTNG